MNDELEQYKQQALKEIENLFDKMLEANKYILDLEKELAVYKKVLKLYREKFKYDCNKCPREVWERCDGNCDVQKIIDFDIDQVRKELGEKDEIL